VKAFLQGLGYVVRGEVSGCDLTAVRAGELVVVELKRAFGLKLLLQATNRQRAADTVYVAIPRPPRGRFSKGFWDMCHLLKRLDLGLLVVSFRMDPPGVEVVHHPSGVQEPAGSGRRNARLRHTILREFSGRSGDYNTGGSTGMPLVTAYREAALRIACCLEKYGVLSAAELRSLGTGEKTYSILYHNLYGWFERVEKGRYGLHEAGRCALSTYAELRARYRKELRRRRPVTARA
jgi:hypothetical protein